MSNHASRRKFIRVVCTDMYIDRQTGIRGARHQQFILGRLPVFVEKDQDGNALPGTEYVGYPADVHVSGSSDLSMGEGWTATGVLIKA
jgi:hypothetical protein